jgi:hypothetical protein
LFNCLGKHSTIKETLRRIHKIQTSRGAELSLHTEPVSGVSGFSGLLPEFSEELN